MIDLKNNNLNYVDEKAFDFKSEKHKRIDIYLNNNKLYSHGFALNSLVNFKRHVTFDLSGNHLKYLHVKVFKPFFNSNPKNTIYIHPYFCNYKWFYFILNFYKDKIERVHTAMLLNSLNLTPGSLTPEINKIIISVYYRRQDFVEKRENQIL